MDSFLNIYGFVASFRQLAVSILVINGFGLKVRVEKGLIIKGMYNFESMLLDFYLGLT